MDGYFSFNEQTSGITYPIPSGYNPFALLDYDPTQKTLALFLAQLLQTNLQPVFSQAAAACGLTNAHLNTFQDGKVVAEVVAYELDETLLSTTNFQFPLLYVFDEGSDFDQHSLVYSSIQRHFSVSWILPPLTPTQLTVMNQFLHLAQGAWLGYVQQGYDPKVNEINIWHTAGVSYGWIEDCQVTKYDGTMTDKSGRELAGKFPCLEFRLTLVERNQLPVPQNYPTGFNKFDIQLNLVDGYSPANPIDNFIDGYVYPTIDLTGTSLSSAPIGNFTWFYLYGTGFDNNRIAGISICGVPVAEYATKSPSTILVVSNPGITGTAGQVGNIVITDLQDNQYILPNSFTYV